MGFHKVLTVFSLFLLITTSIASTAFGAQISWSNASGGNWSTGSNWTGGIVPGATDTALIMLAGTYTVTLDANTTVAGITLGGSSGRRTFALTSKTLTVNGPFNINANGKVYVSSSTITGLGDIAVSDTLSMITATIDLPVHNGGVVMVAGTVDFNDAYSNDPGSILRLWYNSNWGAGINFSSGFTNHGYIEMVNTYSTSNTRLNSPNGPIINSPTGTIVSTGTSGLSYIQAEFDNQGTVDIDHYLQLNYSSANHTNSGTINATGGWLVNNQSGTTPSFTNTGTIVVDSGYVLDVNNGAFNYPSGSIIGEGTIDFHTVTATWVPKLAWPGSLILYSSTLTISDSLLIQNRTPVSYSTINGTGNITVTDTLALIGSTIDVPLHNSGVITAIVANDFNQAYTNDEGSVLYLWYTSNAGAGVNVPDGFTNNGLIELVNTYSTASTSVNSPNGPIVNSPTGTIVSTGTSGLAYIQAEFDNQGTVDIDHYLQLNFASANHTNSGTINITGGNLVINQTGTAPSFINTGTVVVDSGYVLDVNGGDFGNQTTGTLAGSGTIDLTGSVNSFTNAGIISPGMSPGTLTITGMDLIQQPTSNIYIEIGETTSGDFDSLHVSADVTKGGLLSIDLYNGYFPEVGDSVVFLSANSVTGHFDSLDLKIGGVVFDTVSTGNAVALICIQAENYDPTIALDSTISFDADNFAQVDLWTAADDPESPDSLLTFGFITDNDSLIVAFDSSTGIMTLTSDPAYAGAVGLIVSVTDPQGASAADTVLVTVIGAQAVDDERGATLPTRFMLRQNYPNPFNASTVISYGLPHMSHVTIDIYNVLGGKIETLVDERQPAGNHQVVWKAKGISSGMYFYRIQTGEFTETRKMLLIK